MARVLLVEDDETILTAYGLALSQAGYEVDMASDGGEAKVLAAKNKPDAILLDLLMPNVSGLEFLQIYDMDKHPDTVAIVFTNMESPSTEKSAIEFGATKYLTKSDYTPTKIIELIESELAAKRGK